MKEEEIKKAVREGYASLAKGDGFCCAATSTCCGGAQTDMVRSLSKQIGYTDEDLNSVPEGSNLGLGCGNPVALASLREGEVVLDLGSGAGFDCFLAAQRVGESGVVIGVDMTPEMLEKARKNAEKGGFGNVEFRLGEIEHLPVADSSVDVIISNCVINLAPDKDQVFREAYRVLKPGGRLMISDIVLLGELPPQVMSSIEAYIGCVAGALRKEDYLGSIRRAGFEEVEVIEESAFPIESIISDPTAAAIMRDLQLSAEEVGEISKMVLSVKVRALKR